MKYASAIVNNKNNIGGKIGVKKYLFLPFDQNEFVYIAFNTAAYKFSIKN